MTEATMTAEPLMATHANLDCYDAGLLNDHGGGNVNWWQDYIRAELERAHGFYEDQVTRRLSRASPQIDYLALAQRLRERAAEAAEIALATNGPEFREERVFMGTARDMLAAADVFEGLAAKQGGFA